jgi:uncharacterized repeat protein (TIGR01451 family)
MTPRIDPLSFPPTLSILVILIAGPTHADVTASGRAFGSHSTLFGATLSLLTTADTEVQRAAGSGTFSRVADAASIAVPSVADVVSGSSTTSGTSERAEASASSVAGDSDARIFPTAAGGSDALDVATTGASASVDCQTTALTSGLDTATLLGSPLLELDVPANTTILSPAPGLDLVTFNRQRVTVDKKSGSIAVSVEAVRAELMVGGDALTLSLSGAAASLRGLSRECPVLTAPVLANTTAVGAFVSDAGTSSRVDGGDRLRFTVRAENSGGAPTPAVSIVGRVPSNLSADVATVRVEGSSAPATLSPCSAAYAFRGCAREAESDPARQCLTVEIGSLAAGARREVAFEGVAANGQDVCSSVLVPGLGQETTAIVLGAGGEAPAPAATTETTLSGGPA